MTYNFEKKGIYPGEPGYREWTGFEVQMKIPGTTTTKYNPIHPLKFHEKLLKKRLLKLKRGETYTDFKIRCEAELDKNKKFFQPKEWSVEKLLYNYDLLFQLGFKLADIDKEYLEALKDHIKFLYNTYRVNIKHRSSLNG